MTFIPKNIPVDFYQAGVLVLGEDNMQHIDTNIMVLANPDWNEPLENIIAMFQEVLSYLG